MVISKINLHKMGCKKREKDATDAWRECCYPEETLRSLQGIAIDVSSYRSQELHKSDKNTGCCYKNANEKGDIINEKITKTFR